MENFNLNWKFKKIDCEVWQTVNLPHDAMLYEKRDANCHNGTNTGYFPGGKYIYEKVFAVSADTVSKQITVLFEGVYQNCTVSLNEKQICSHKYGYTEFTVDLTGKVVAGENTISIFVDNSLEPNCRWYTGSGIYRPVSFFISEPGAPKLLKVSTVSIHPAQIQVETEVGNNITIFNGQKKIIEKTAVEQRTVIDISDAKLWGENHPHLYQVMASNCHGEKSTDFGIRSLTWDSKKGLLVNGERVLLRGGCIHHDNGVLGACGFSDAEERRVRILKEAGYNAIRSAHNPMSRDMLDACDRLGVFVMDECFDGWYTPKTYHDNSRSFEEFWREDLSTMIEKDFNHPSVIMYSIGNEVTETTSEKGLKVCGDMRSFVKAMDSSRPVTAGINVLLNVYTNKGMGVYKDKGNYEAKPLPPKTNGYKEKKSGSAFFNMMVGKLGGLMFRMSAGKKGDKASYGAAENLDIIGLNYAASRFEPDMKKYPERIMVASETMVTDLAYNWPFVEKYPAILGDFAWSAWDYLGEAGIGDWAYLNYPGLPLLAGCGTIDITGNITAENAFEQVIWGLRKTPFIGVEPLNHIGETPKKSSWRFTNVIDSWSWDGCENKTAKVEVFATGEAVRLELNGKTIGTKKLKDYKTSFNCPYKKGTITAIALDASKRELSRFSLTSGEETTCLLVKPEKTSIPADGMSLCYIPIVFTDPSGELKPFVEEAITVTVKGAGTLAGFGSAQSKTDESYTGNIFTSYRGRALAVIRSTTEPGEIKVHIKTKSGLVETVCIQSN